MTNEISDNITMQKVLLWCLGIILLISVPVGFFYLKNKKENWATNFIGESSQYLKISQSGIPVNQAEADKYINLLKNTKIKRGATVGDELEKSFPSAPRYCRGWEFHVYNNEKYVCYVVRSQLGTSLEFIWLIMEQYGEISFLPQNGAAFFIQQLESENGSSDESLKDETEADKRVILYLSDRECAFDQEGCEQQTMKDASGKFGLAESTIRNLWEKHTQKWSRIRDAMK